MSLYSTSVLEAAVCPSESGWMRLKAVKLYGVVYVHKYTVPLDSSSWTIMYDSCC